MQTSSYRSCLTALGSEIRKRRESLGLTQEEAGEILSLDRVYVGYIEQGRRAPSLRTLFSISKAYGVPISTFFSSDFEAALATLELASSLDDDQMTHEPSDTSASAPAKRSAKRGKRAASASAKRAPAEAAVKNGAGKKATEKDSSASGRPAEAPVALMPTGDTSRLAAHDAVDQVAGIPDARGTHGAPAARVSDDTVTTGRSRG